MPLVSVILPNYNHAPYLDKRIQSILNQTFTDLELIILDDCSPDNSRDIIERYRSDQRVSHIIFNEVNSGSTFQQWEKGISVSVGEYIWIAESDDYCEPSFLQELVGPLTRDPGLVMAFCQCLFVSPDGDIIAQTGSKQLENRLSGKEFLTRYMMGNNGIPNVSMLVFRKSGKAQLPDSYTKLKYCGDWLFYTLLALQGNVYISGKYLNYYLRHKETVTSTALSMGYDFLEGDEVFKFIRKNIAVNDADLLYALNTRIDRYIQIRDHFLNSDVDQQVRQSLWSLDDRTQLLFNKKLRNRQLRAYMKRISRLFLK